jgi:hypothetical protein
MAGTRPEARMRRGRRPPISDLTFALIPNLLDTFYLRMNGTEIKPTFTSWVNVIPNGFLRAKIAAPMGWS